MFQQIRSSQAHELYHEAQRRSQQPQPLIKHRRPKSLLLPAPNNIIFELFNTIIREIPEERLVEFVKGNLRDYLLTNWTNKITQQMIGRLMREQALDVRAGLASLPMIKHSTGALTGRTPTTIIDVRRLTARSPPSSARSPPPNQTSAPAGTTSPTGAAAGTTGATTTTTTTTTSTTTSNTTTNNAQTSNATSANEPALVPVGSRTSAQNNQQARPMIRSVSGSKAREQAASVDAQAAASLQQQQQQQQQQRQAQVAQIYEHLMWRIHTDNVTQVSSLLIKMALDDGYRSGKLKSEPYEEVAACFEDWRGQKLIKLYSFGAAPEKEQRLVLASTQLGDLTRWVANYMDGSQKRQKPEMIRVLAAMLRDRTKNCIFITNELIDAIKSLDSGAIRCVFLVDRLNRYEPITSMPNFTSQIEPLIASGKLFVMSTLACVEFAPDPAADTCC